MKPIRRRIRNNFGLTAKQVAIRSRRPWYFQTFLAVAFVVLGFVIAYWMLHDAESERLRLRLQQVELENRTLGAKLVEAQRGLEVELATNNNLAKELASVQDESLKVKEDLVFYKNMLSKRSK
ncbi:MAG TPA: hypothetical protein VGD04_05260 [Methylophilus sp.]